MANTFSTGFMSLPLELRQEMYSKILPADRVFNFPASQQRWKEEERVSLVCAAHPGIKEELEEFAFNHCGASITVTPDKEIGLPAEMEWNRFQYINIKIDYCNASSWNRPGLRELIAGLRYGWPDTLPPMTITFREENFSNLFGDSQWTQEVPLRSSYRWHENEYDSGLESEGSYSQYRDPMDEILDEQRRNEVDDDEDEDTDDSDSDNHSDIADLNNDSDEDEETWLRTAGRFGNPIAADILGYFLALPPCKSTIVKPLQGLKGRRLELPRYDNQARIFDKLYMVDLCAALELWLDGEREGVELASEEGEFGEPKLEQLAYRREGEEGERLYCDRRQSGRHWYEWRRDCLF